MAPKKPKELDQNENWWRTSIETAQLDEENWQVKVIMIEVAGSDQDRIYMNKFETYAAEEKRFVIKNICKSETVFMVNQLGAEKKVKDESLRVFEEGNFYLKEKKDIPSDIYALVIKHLILKMKEEYLFIRQQKLEVKEGMRRESTTMIDKTEVRGTVSSVPPPEPTPSPPPPSGVQIPELDKSKKFNTLLRERGEEWRDKVYVDDYPIDGPNLYVAVTGFVDPFLPGCLINIGIPLTAIIQIRIDPNITPLPSTLTRATKRGQSQTDILAAQSLKFWDILQSLRIQNETANDFKDTAFLVYFPPYWEKGALSGDPDKIYDELCFLMYDVQDMSRQHLHYLDNMDIIVIPESSYDEHYKKYYHQLIANIPLECITIYSVLDSIVSTTCKEEGMKSTSSASSSTTDTLNAINKLNEKSKISEVIVKEVFKTLCKTETDKKSYRITFGEEYETHKDPVVIDYGDFAKYNTFHLGNTNLKQIVFSSLLGLPVHKLWQSQDRLKDDIEAKANFHVNVLLSCFERSDVETSELNRMLHILACRKIYNNRSSLKKVHLQTTTISDFKKIYLKRSVLAEPLPTCPSVTQNNVVLPPQPSMTKSVDQSEVSSTYEDQDMETNRIKLLFDCPDISELVSAVEIANNKPIDHMIDKFDCFEDFNGINAFQIMSDAYNKFNCVDYKYCEVTDCFILMFFNSHDEDGISRDEWRCHLSTPICLQDFFDYVLEEHYDWIKQQEALYDTDIQIKEKSESKDHSNQDALQLCLEDTEVAMDLLMEGSLKHQELLGDAEEEIPENSDGLDQPTNTATTGSKNSKKSPPTARPKNVKHPVERSTTSLESVKIRAKPFLGYDLGNRRVEIFGKNATFFSKDGTKVSSKYSLIIPFNLEYIIMNITPGNNNNEFWLHKALGEFVSPEITDMCESFRITAKNQVMINIKKQSFQNLIESNNIYTSSIQINQQEFETNSIYKLFLTWPNGMITETMHEENSCALSHIKQYHVCDIPVLDEVMRCISLNGEVIIFKDSGEIEVLKPDGSCIKIMDYYKSVVTVHEEPEEHIEDISDKSKKAKDKTSSKVKTSKMSTKLSKNELSEFEYKKTVKYELIIDGFEIIEASGVRQQYVKDIPFDLEKLLVRTATDYCLGEIFSKRMDGTTTLLNKDGVFIATFPDKTRIISYYVIGEDEIYPEWTHEEKEYLNIDESEVEVVSSKYSDSQSCTENGLPKKVEEEIKDKHRSDGYVSVTMVYIIEHCNFSTITINKFENEVSVDSPNNMTIVIDKNNRYKFSLDASTSAEFDGEYLNISYEACPQCRAFTTCNVQVQSSSSEKENTVKQGWVKMQDSFCKKIVIDDEGAIETVDDVSSEGTCPHDEQTEQQIPLEDNKKEFTNIGENEDDNVPDGKSESSVASHGNCRQMYLAKSIRFFVLRRELSCSELVHRSLLNKYQTACQWQPWCSIKKHDTFGDHRSTLSILTPIHLTETEKWLMNSKFADKPKYLTYKDLKVDTGKGFYHWMRPYKRFAPTPLKPDCILPPRLPRAFILRTLEQQWNTEAEELKGAKELLKAILKYRNVMAADRETLLNVPIRDPRSEAERCVDDYVQNIGHKIYQDLRKRLAEDVESRAKAAITTKPPPPQSEEMYVEGEFEEEDSVTKLREEMEEVIRQTEKAEEMSPNLARYWRRRAEELKQEQFFKYLLRQAVVPPYFKNKQGAVWWSLMDLANKAVDLSERRKIRCICAEEMNSKQSEGTDLTFK